jgi:uncharacterized repeat protein (TIGR04138 family)
MREMQKPFNEVVDQIVERDPRYEKGAYLFLKEALEYTLKQLKRGQSDPNSHVTAAQLLDGFRQLALKEFGPMAMTVLEYWRVTSSDDVGSMVFAFIEAGVFGKTDSDNLADFNQSLDFHAAFVTPFEAVGPKPANSP